jgi:hypothetical protein
MNHISLSLFMAIKLEYFVLCHLGRGRVWTWMYNPPMRFTILSDRWVGNTGCPAKSSTKGGHPSRSATMSFSQVQRVLTVEHYLASCSYLTCQNEFWDTFPDYPVPNKSSIISRMVNCSQPLQKHFTGLHQTLGKE